MLSTGMPLWLGMVSTLNYSEPRIIATLASGKATYFSKLHKYALFRRVGCVIFVIHTLKLNCFVLLDILREGVISYMVLPVKSLWFLCRFCKMWTWLAICSTSKATLHFVLYIIQVENDFLHQVAFAFFLNALT